MGPRRCLQRSRTATGLTNLSTCLMNLTDPFFTGDYSTTLIRNESRPADIILAG